MRIRHLAIGVMGATLTLGVTTAHGGAIRTTGKHIGKASVAIAGTTAGAIGVAAGGVATAGKATGGAIKDDAPSVGKDVAAAPGDVVRGTEHVGKAIWKVVW